MIRLRRVSGHQRVVDDFKQSTGVSRKGAPIIGGPDYEGARSNQCSAKHSDVRFKSGYRFAFREHESPPMLANAKGRPLRRTSQRPPPDLNLPGRCSAWRCAGCPGKGLHTSKWPRHEDRSGASWQIESGPREGWGLTTRVVGDTSRCRRLGPGQKLETSAGFGGDAEDVGTSRASPGTRKPPPRPAARLLTSWTRPDMTVIW